VALAAGEKALKCDAWVTDSLTHKSRREKMVLSLIMTNHPRQNGSGTAILCRTALNAG
jgi:hypothetical protein